MSGIRYRRLFILMEIFSIAFLLLLLKLMQLQLLSGDNLAVKAVQSRMRYISGEDYPRGEILDRNGVFLTDTKAVPALVLFPSMVENKGELIDTLSKILNIPEGVIRGKLSRNTYSFIPNLTPAQVEKIRALNGKGAYVLLLKARYGPESLARHVIGHVNSVDPETWELFHGKSAQGDKEAYDITDTIGVKGIEAIYENYLRCRDPEFYWLATVDGRGKIIPGLSFNEVVAREKTDRNSIVLTIDRGLQKKVEQVMDGMIPRGAVVVMDVLNGDILAIASRPNYDQNLIGAYIKPGPGDEKKVFNNRALEHYHPGSVFKILIALAALEEGLVSMDETFFCSGKYVFASGLTINCWDQDGHGEITFGKSLAYSCNSVFIEVALRLGRDKILEYAEKFNLKVDRGVIGYPVDKYTSININPYGEGKVANAALGQEGVRLSPVQIAGMIAAIANDGLIVKPRLVKEIRDFHGKTLKMFMPERPVQVVSKKTARRVKEMLTHVTEWGTGKRAWVPGYGSAGKTGSAETGLIDGGGRSVKNAWFAGYVPLNKPRYAIVVLAEGGKSGGETAAPVFREIASYIMENL